MCMKIVCMIPVRMDSKRVPKKNIRLLGGKPLVAWAIEAAKKANCFDDIYINSEDEIFRGIADEYGVKFYKRRMCLSSDYATNDEFASDFIDNVECDYLFQLLSTSPFVGPEDIKELVSKHGLYDTVISVKEIRIECLYKLRPINFVQTEQTMPSQQLTPIDAYACCMMLWKTKIYKMNMANGGAYHGNFGRKLFYPIKGFSTIDIDNEEDFDLAEAIVNIKKTKPIYYESKKR